MTGVAFAQKIYYADLHMLKRVNTDGSELETLIESPLSNPSGVAIDVEGGKLYWADSFTGSIRRANLDGSQPEVILETDPENPREPGQIALDLTAGKLYWCDGAYFNLAWHGRIGRSNLDGSDVELLVPFMSEPLSGLALDLINAKMYAVVSGAIVRWDLNGANQQSLVPNACAYHIALDASAGAMYWAGCNVIGNAALDGSSADFLFDNLGWPRGIALDLPAGRIYWTDALTRKIQRANLDGSQVEDVADAGGGVARGIVLDGSGGLMYWGAAGRIRRATLEGKDAVDVLQAPILTSRGLALDPSGGHLYWANEFMGTVRRSALNGMNGESVLTELVAPWGVALHVEKEALYVADIDAQQIVRSGLDGSKMEVLPAAAPFPKSLALDLAASQMFMTAAGTIQTRDLNGLSPTTVIGSGLSAPLTIALDHIHGKMYWTETGKIRRANLDGTVIENLISRSALLYAPVGIVVDPFGGKIYWTDTIYGVKQASLNGTNIQTVVSNALRPEGLVLDTRLAGDRNGDGWVNLRDWALYQTCFTGGGTVSADPTCSFFDRYPTDGDVDLIDFEGIHSAFDPGKLP